ncbi:unnamed protein product [Nyctereutes procyonoides]|uniref:(raccoon dog) hypothetical protein n=1 Tax=Nyctereutes procyonoides TaxID=34880 RepID=A0A811Z5I7_NYCPR|nr:unnamed protein product [Nyctereutes procyonoides]
MRDDTLYENGDMKEALRRALDLAKTQQISPKELWTKYEMDTFYILPELKEWAKKSS